MKKNLSFVMAIFFLIRFGYAQQLPNQMGDKTPYSNGAKAQWDVLYTHNYATTEPGTTAAFYWDKKVYTSQPDSSLPGVINCFNISEDKLIPNGKITITGVTGTSNFSGFTTDGTYIYAVNKSNIIHKIDPATWTINSTITVNNTNKYVAIAYDKASKGFWLCTNGVNNAVLVSATGTLTSTTLTATGIAVQSGLVGLAYDDVTPDGPYLWTSNGPGPAHNTATIGRWNIATKVYTNNIKNVASSLPEEVASNNYMGGIFTYNTGAKYCLLGVSQGAKLVFAYELAKLKEPEAPEAVADLSITPDASGDLTALLTWTNPTLTIDENPLTELIAINIYENNYELPIASISPTGIGSSCSYIATVYSPGIYTYKVVAENSIDEGIATTTSPVWIGLDVPSAPDNVELIIDDMIANLSWDAPTTGLHAGYFTETGIVYDVYRFPNNVLVSENQTKTTFTDTLQPGIYYYKIVAKNESGEGGNANSNQETFCPVISTFPWEEGFENGFNCWTQEHVSGRELVWKTEKTEIPPLSGSYSAYIGSEKDGYTSRLISPVLDISALSFPTINFWMYPQDWSSNLHTLKVYYRTSSTSNWEELASYSSGASNEWHSKSLALLEPSATYQIAFEIVCKNLSIVGMNNMGIGLDDIEIFNDNITCPPPTAVTIPATTITTSQAVVNWTAGSTETAWIVEYKISTASSWIAQNVSDTSTITLSNLDANKEYCVRVKAICGEENESRFTTQQCFKTKQVVVIPTYKITATASANGTISPSGDTTVLAGASVTFTFTPNNGYRVEKLLVDNETVEITENRYTFSEVDTNHSIHVDFATVGITEYDLENIITLYPNPATNQVFVETRGSSSLQGVVIFDIMGKSHASRIIRNENGEMSINISHLSSGIYFVQLNTEKGILTKKLIKE